MESNKNIQSILDSISNLNLDDLVQLSNALALKYGYKDLKEFLQAMNPGASSQSNTDSEETESSESKLCDVILVDIDPSQKAAVIRKIKAIMECTSLDAKQHSESLPLKIKSGILHSDADEIIKEWALSGAKLEKK